MDQRLQPRRPLLGVVLTGGRATWHLIVRLAATGFTLLAALLAATERHRVCNAWGRCDSDDWGPAHTLVSDAGGWPFFLVALILALQLGGLRRSMLPALLTAIGSLVCATILLGVVALAHLLSNVDGGAGTPFMAFVVMVLSLAQIVLEPVLVVGQRKQLEARDPMFPRAAVVQR